MALLEKKIAKENFLFFLQKITCILTSKNVDKARFKKFDTLLQSAIEGGIKCSFKRESDLYQ
jgi:hypothetical protein